MSIQLTSRTAGGRTPTVVRLADVALSEHFLVENVVLQGEYISSQQRFNLHRSTR